MNYVAYGLRIVSDIPLPELQSLPPDDQPADLRLRFINRAPALPEPTAWVIRLDRPTGQPWLFCARINGGYFLRFVNIADFVVDASGLDACCCSTLLDFADADLHHVALDQVMPLVLKLRGFEPLHASAFATAGGITAFIGPGGSGKSTIASTFLRQGHTIVGDDCLPLYCRDGQIYAVPAYPGVRLWHGSRKSRWLPPAGLATFPAAHAPLTRVYRVDRESGAAHPRSRVERMSMRDAVMELVASTFRFDGDDRLALTKEFEMCDRISRVVPVRRLLIREGEDEAVARDLVLADLDRS
jgi:hypothetical protein